MALLVGLLLILPSHLVLLAQESDKSSLIVKESEVTVIPSPARCIPEKKVVKLRKSDNLSLHFFPSCTRIERCGGCCPLEEFFSCQPTEIEIVNFKVFVSKYTGSTQLKPLGYEIVKVEKHLACKCDCIIKETDCNPLQEYVKQECKCTCTNNDEKRKCLEDDQKIKFWDSNSCSCQCLIVKDCTTGYIFNKHSCSCEAEQRSRVKFGSYNLESRGASRKTDT